MDALFTNDAVVFGILMVVLALVFYTSSLDHKGWNRFYTIFPPLLLCYFIPGILVWPIGLIHDPDDSLYYVASRFLLPASLVLLCLNIDFPGLMKLGPKALIMFVTGTVGIVIGGPIAILFLNYVAPGLIDLDPYDLWTGMATIAGSWIGGSANQTAMKEIFNVSDVVFSSMVVVDIIIANIWMALLLYGAGITDRIDRWLKADTSAIVELREKLDDYRTSVEAVPATRHMFILLGIGFGGVALSHAFAGIIVPRLQGYEATLNALNMQTLLSSFFWIIVISTTVGLILSFTRLRTYEGYGASKWGTMFIYIMVATIGMKMNFKDIIDNAGLFLLGAVWMLIHAILLILVAKLIRAPFFFAAVGSQANVGGAASAPVVASAFSPSLSAVGVILAVMGYALGTYMALACAYIMQWVANW